MAYLKEINNHFWICVGSILIVKQKKPVLSISKQTAFLKINLGFVDSGLGVRSDEKVEKLSSEIKL